MELVIDLKGTHNSTLSFALFFYNGVGSHVQALLDVGVLSSNEDIFVPNPYPSALPNEGGV